MKHTMMIADDNPIITEGIRNLILDQFSQIQVTGTYSNGQSIIEALACGTADYPDILISDIRMPLADGIQVCKYLKESGASTRLILITAYKDFEYARNALNLGVEHLLVKPFASEELLDCVRRVMNCREQEKKQKERLSPNLSESERLLTVQNVVQYVEKHCQNSSLSVLQIAEHFDISSNYLSSMFKKEQGVSLVQYITASRIEKAKELLQQSPRLLIADVAKAVGYADEGYFHKVFKKTVGITPAQYKKVVKSHDQDF